MSRWIRKDHWPRWSVMWLGLFLIFGVLFVGCVGISQGGVSSGLLVVLILLFVAGCSQTIYIGNQEPAESTGETTSSKESHSSPDEVTSSQESNPSPDETNTPPQEMGIEPGRPDENNTQPDDAGTTPDGTWEPCCQNGKISSCFCPAGAACNYGWFTTCENGTCVAGPQASCDEKTQPDAGEFVAEVGPEPQPEPRVEAGPESQPEPRPEPISEPQPEPQPEQKGRWESCCVDNKISQCFCPENMACNYGWYTPCANNTCVGPTQQCP